VSKINDGDHAIRIGDELFRYVELGGIFRYVVYGIRQYEDGDQYEVECQTCSHGERCRLLIARDDYGRLIHIHMLNEDEDLCDEHRCWHTNDGYHFWPTFGQAKEESFKRAIEKAEESVSEAEKLLADRQKRLAELKSLLSAGAAGEGHP